MTNFLLLFLLLCEVSSWLSHVIIVGDGVTTEATYSAGYRRKLTEKQQSMAKYLRIYSQLRLGKFYYYHRQYYYHSRLLSHKIRIEGSYYCKNLEANDYGDFIGYYYCPLEFEPSNFTVCCGATDYNYCCDDMSRMHQNPYSRDSFNIDSSIFGIFVGIFLAGLVGFSILSAAVFGIIYVCCLRKKGFLSSQRKPGVMMNNTRSTGTVQPAERVSDTEVTDQTETSEPMHSEPVSSLDPQPQGSNASPSTQTSTVSIDTSSG